MAVLLMLVFNPALGVCDMQPDQYAPCDDDIPAGWKLVEGDILVPDIPLQTIFLKYIYRGQYWPAGVVPYQFAPNVSPNNQALARSAMQEWEKVANVYFVERNQEEDFLYIQSHSRINSSNIGNIGGKQTVNINHWEKFTIVHELGHVLGLVHEQTRADRDNYITVNRANVDPDLTDQEFEDNFGKELAQYTDVYGPYDFDSVMHYGQCAGSICADCSADPVNCRTITVKSPWDVKWQDAIGQSDHLSNLDALTMSFLYPFDDWVFVNGSYELAPSCIPQFGVGTFLSPYCEFTTASEFVPPGGTVIIQPGIYSAVGVYSNPMILQAPLGDVTLGE